MNAKELAEQLNGTEYPVSISHELGRAARDAGLVIVYGASDDLMEFRGAIEAELGSYEGTKAHLTSQGLLTNDCDCDDCPHFARQKKSAATIDALWCKEDDYSWTYQTAIPHETFEVMEDGEKYCRGIVFALADVKERA